MGIGNLEEALQPFYTTSSGEERSGMGFTVMQTFYGRDASLLHSRPGTKVTLLKKIGK